jgi:hypothetical protein
MAIQVQTFIPLNAPQFTPMVPSIVRQASADYDYSRIKALERGADSNVYLAIDLATADAQLVAVKVLEKVRDSAKIYCPQRLTFNQRDPFELYRSSELIELQQEYEKQVLLITLHPYRVALS